MKAIGKIAATGVLLCGVALAQSRATGKFTFIVPESGKITCTDAAEIDIIANADVVIAAGGTAASSPAEVKCVIETLYPRWDLSVTPTQLGFLISGTDTLKVDGDYAELDIYVTLENSTDPNYNPIKIAQIGVDYNDAIVTPVPFDTTATTAFPLAAAFSKTSGDRFVVDGETKAMFTVKGAPMSRTSSTRVTSVPGSYVETLEFEIVTVF